MQPVRVLIVDDEPLAREGVRLHLELESDFDVVGEVGSGEEAVARIREQAPDLVFLDVQMPGMDGFGVIEAVGVERMPVTIFVTAYDQFALKAFAAHALDYLLKPYDAERFRSAIERARTQLRARRFGDVEGQLAALLTELRGQREYLERIVVRSGGRILILRVDDIDWLEAASNYVRIHAGGRQYLLRETMSNLEARLDPGRFVRIHRSTMVRLDRVRELEPLFQGDYVLILEDGTRLTSSRGYRDRLQGLLQA
ncbi:MAG: response regulator transcription factor [Gemmatimonadetes bacterium]|nr:response regulator transcription factor [Gemmatimonadota bacterium]